MAQANPHEILLSKEQMAFFVLNTFAHDPALHDFGPSKKSNVDTGDMAGSRQYAVLSKNPQYTGGQKGGAVNSDVLLADANATFSDCVMKNVMVHFDDGVLDVSGRYSVYRCERNINGIFRCSWDSDVFAYGSSDASEARFYEVVSLHQKTATGAI